MYLIVRREVSPYGKKTVCDSYPDKIYKSNHNPKGIERLSEVMTRILILLSSALHCFRAGHLAFFTVSESPLPRHRRRSGTTRYTLSSSAASVSAVHAAGRVRRGGRVLAIPQSRVNVVNVEGLVRFPLALGTRGLGRRRR